MPKRAWRLKIKLLGSALALKDPCIRILGPKVPTYGLLDGQSIHIHIYILYDYMGTWTRRVGFRAWVVGLSVAEIGV